MGKILGSLLRVFMRGYNCKIFPYPVPLCGIYYIIVLVDSLVQKDSSVCQNIEKFGGSI